MAKQVRFEPPLGESIPKCCEGVTGYQAVRSVRADTGEYGLVLESLGCGCDSRWIPHDWRKGLPEFVKA